LRALRRIRRAPLMRLFRRQGITGWRRHPPVFGKPDFVFPRLKLAVFVDGGFWHRCPKHSNLPLNNRRFWKRKLEANRQRDSLVGRTLRARGWHVLRVWQHELSPRNEKRLLRRIQRVGCPCNDPECGLHSRWPPPKAVTSDEQTKTRSQESGVTRKGHPSDFRNPRY